MSSRTDGWFPFDGSDVDPGGYGGRDELPSRGAPTALRSGVLVLMVGRGWRVGRMETGPAPHRTSDHNGVGVRGPRANGWTGLAWGWAGGAPGLGPLRFWNESVGPAVPALHSSLCTLHSALVFSPQAVVHQPGFDGRGAASAATTGKREFFEFEISTSSLELNGICINRT